MKKKLLTIYLVCLSICTIFADNNDLLTGLDAYSRGDWTTATKSFKRAFTTAEPDDRTEALYWLAMSETSAQNYRHALDYADMSLETAPEDERVAEVIYQKGRILHLSGDYEKSSKTLHRFIEDYPEHPKIPSAYYWIGENFYAAGNYAEARKIFGNVVVNYPQSGKVSEARYKIILIDQQSIREELLRIALEAHTATVQVKKIPEVVEAEPKPDETEAAAADSDTESASVADDTSLIEEQEQDKEIADRLAVLEKKLDELSVMLAKIAEEQEAQRAREQQQAFEQQQREEQQQKEQEEAERLQLEERRRELVDLKERTKTLEKLYEQRTKGAK